MNRKGLYLGSGAGILRKASLFNLCAKSREAVEALTRNLPLPMKDYG